MTTFKTFLRVLRKNAWIIVMYSVIMIFCSIANSQSNSGMTNFAAVKPDIIIYDHDESKISKQLKGYIEERSNQPMISNHADGLDDALYYNGVDYVIILEKGFGKKVANGEKPEVEVKSVGNYAAYLSESMLSRYMSVVNAIAPASEEIIVESANNILSHETKVELTKKIDTTALSNLALFFTFMNYPILAGLVFAVAYTTASFKRKMVKKRMVVSATDYNALSRKLLLYNLGVAAILLISYIIVAFILNGWILFSTHGLMMILNAVIMSIYATSFALLLTSLLDNNNAILAVVNVVSIGSSFLAGVFIPIEWMPEAVVNIGRVLPSFYYVSSNTEIAKIEDFNFDNLQPILLNMLIILGATILTIVISNIIVKKHKKD